MSLYPQICLVNRMHLHDMKYIWKQLKFFEKHNSILSCCSSYYKMQVMSLANWYEITFFVNDVGAINQVFIPTF